MDGQVVEGRTFDHRQKYYGAPMMELELDG